MKTEERKDFDREAAAWDQDPGRVKLANDVADAIIRESGPNGTMDVLDFGCGTGLVTLRLQPLVRTITGADSSKGMLGVLEEKIRTLGLPNVRTQYVDFEQGECVEGKFHLLISSMTLHHVPNTAVLFKQWYNLLLPGGVLAAADLDAEDGSFHVDPDERAIVLQGFHRDELAARAAAAGFVDVTFSDVWEIPKNDQVYGVFLLVARHP